MNRNIFNVTLTILTICLLQCFNTKAGEISDADSAYLRGNYQEAVALYSQCIENDGVSTGLLYNLGNSYYKQGSIDQAILCYERAKKLDPGNENINSNLAYLQMRVTDANKASLIDGRGYVEADHESFIDSLYRIIAIEKTSNSWAVLAIISFLLFLGAMALYMFTPVVLARKTGFFSGLIFIGFTIIFIIFSYLGAKQFHNQEEAILTMVTAELLEQPDPQSTPSSSILHRGTKLHILETKKGADGTEWLKVKLNSDNIGWIKKGNIEVI